MKSSTKTCEDERKKGATAWKFVCWYQTFMLMKKKTERWRVSKKRCGWNPVWKKRLTGEWLSEVCQKFFETKNRFFYLKWQTPSLKRLVQSKGIIINFYYFGHSSVDQTILGRLMLRRFFPWGTTQPSKLVGSWVHCTVFTCKNIDTYFTYNGRISSSSLLLLSHFQFSYSLFSWKERKTS